jgi:hypothetical protein
MADQWIQGCAVRRIMLHDDLALDFDDYNELVIFGPLRLTLPAADGYLVEVVSIDPKAIPNHQRPLFDFAGTTCTQAVWDEDGHLHLEFSGGHQIDVPANDDVTAWELYGKHHGYMACLPYGKVRVVRTTCPQHVVAQ